MLRRFRSTLERWNMVYDKQLAVAYLSLAVAMPFLFVYFVLSKI